MKSRFFFPPFLLSAVCPPIALVAAAENPAAAAMTTAALDTAGAVAQPLIVDLAQQHPWLISALAVIASLRLVFKPIMSALALYVRSTPSTADDALLDRVEHSRAYRIAAWLLDYLGSIKVGPQRSAPPPAGSAHVETTWPRT